MFPLRAPHFIRTFLSPEETFAELNQALVVVKKAAFLLVPLFKKNTGPLALVNFVPGLRVERINCLPISLRREMAKGHQRVLHRTQREFGATGKYVGEGSELLHRGPWEIEHLSSVFWRTLRHRGLHCLLGRLN